MRIFADNYSLFILKVLELFKKTPHLSLMYEFDSADYFKKIIRKKTGIPVFAELKISDVRLPKLHIARFGFWKEGIFVGGIAGHTDKKVADLKAQGEFIERLASYLPENIQVNFTVRSLLGFSRINVSTSDLYWGLGSKGQKHQITTSGVAGHFSKKEAIVSAWLELVERDAFMVHWLNSIPPKHINIGKIVEESICFQNLIGEMEKKNIKYYFLDITSDVQVPVCACIVLMDSSTGPRIGVGAKAGFEASPVLEGALLEALGVLETIITTEPYYLPEDYTPFRSLQLRKSERARLYLSDKGFSLLSFFLQSQEKISLEAFIGNTQKGDPLTLLQTIFKERKQKDLRYAVYAYSFSHPLLDAFDYKVVRVICKALYPIYLIESYADINHPRLKEFVKNKGYEKIAQLNTAPHPFP